MKQDDIGKFISKCRKEKHLTQSQLAEILGVSDKSISRWENGKTMMDMSLYEPLCRALDIQLIELLKGERLSSKQKEIQREKAALNILITKSQLKTLTIFTEILIVVGIIISITLTNLLAFTTIQKIITLSCGCFVWGFGLFLRVKIRKTINKLEEDVTK